MTTAGRATARPPRATAAPGDSERLGHGPRRPQSRIGRAAMVFEYFLVTYRRTWKGSIISRFLSPLLFMLAMGVGLGAIVNSRSGGVGGVPYLQFIAPGILVNQAMFLAVGECTYPVRGLIEWNKMFHSMVATPLGVPDLVLGHMLVMTAHLTFASTVFVGVAALFGAFGSWVAALWAVPVSVLMGLAFALPVTAFTATVQGDAPFSILFRLVVTPLMLFSGVFFPVSQLPMWMQPLAWATPLWHGVELARGPLLGHLSFGVTLVHLAVVAGFVVAGWVWAIRALRRRLTP